MRDEPLVAEQPLTGIDSLPAMDAASRALDSFKAEAQTTDCHSSDIAQWHWKKVLAALAD